MPSENALEELVASMTVGELARMSGQSVGSIAVFALASQSQKQSPSEPSRSRSGNGRARPPGPRGGRVDTRSTSGREAYETAVLGVVESAMEAVSAVEVRAAVGGTAQQARAALNRLIEAGKVKYRGKARGTRYFT